VKKRSSAINDLLQVTAILRSPKGCPWDRQQNHKTLRYLAIEEVYELLDAIEDGDDHDMAEELGDLLFHVVFHCQLARERGAFDFEQVARHITDKLLRRHPHVFGNLKVRNVNEVWANWEKIKAAEKHGTHRARTSALDGIPRHLPALMRAEKLLKKARKAKLLDAATPAPTSPPIVREGDRPAAATFKKAALARQLFDLARQAQSLGWSAEELLRAEIARQERALRHREKKTQAAG